MTDTPMLDIIAADEIFIDSTQIVKAIRELNEHYATLSGASQLRLDISLRCTEQGWAIFYDASNSGVLTPRGHAAYSMAEDAIQALREKVDSWIAEATAQKDRP